MIRAGGEKGGMGCLFSFGFRRYNEFTILLLGRGWAMKPADQTGTLLKGAFALTLAAVVTKILSAVYRVPFQNIVGDIGFYIYQQIYPIYAFALVLSTYGFPVVLSKLYTERKNSGGREDVHRLLVVSGGFIFVICAVFFFILYFGARRLAVLMGDPELAVLIQTGAAVFLLVPFISVLRGYFQGKGNMIPTASSQVAEQFIRVATILAASIVLLKEGFDLYRVGAGAVFGTVTGALAGLLVLGAFMRKAVKNGGRPRLGLKGPAAWRDTKIIVKTLFLQGLAICISNMLLIFMQFADSLNLYSLLVASGLNAEEAKAWKGVYDRGQPLIQFGVVAATSMSLSLVPLIANEKMKGHNESLRKFIQLALKVGFVIGLGAAAGLFGIMEPTNIMLFENAKGTEVLRLLGWMILPASLIITVVAVLQGLGLLFFPAVVVLGGFAAKYAFNVLFIPAYGTMGAALASNLALWLIFAVLYIRLVLFCRQSFLTGRDVVVAAGAALLMAAVLKIFLTAAAFVFPESGDRIPAALQALSAVAVGGFTYLLVIFRKKVFADEDWMLLPFGHKLLSLFSQRNRRVAS